MKLLIQHGYQENDDEDSITHGNYMFLPNLNEIFAPIKIIVVIDRLGFDKESALLMGENGSKEASPLAVNAFLNTRFKN